MRLLDLLAAALGMPATQIRGLLEAAIAAAPDLADSLGAFLAKLDDAATPANITELLTAIPHEIAEALQFKFSPRNHPSDAA